ncbi:MAG TPA: PAS domain S-box protein [Syntrophorhabdales bacterium]|nr:PAS domain S-box protein [Syntrophorhabdales bacterium]
MKSNRTIRQLEAEVEALGLRIDEAGEILRAIRNYEVDALVVKGRDGDQVFTLQGAERPYRIFMEAMSEGALTVAADGMILYCNSRLSELIGAPLNKLIGASFHDIVVSRNGQSLGEMLHVCGVNGCRGDFVLKSLKGGEVPVSLSARALMLDDVEAFCIVATDLTERMRSQAAPEKARDNLEERVAERTAELSQVNAALNREIMGHMEAEQALRRAEEELRRERDRITEYVNIAGVMLMVLDRGGRVTLMNRKGYEILGYEEGELLGKDWIAACLPARIKDEMTRAFEKLIDEGLESVEYHENPVLTKQGEERIIAWHNTVLRDEAGNITGSLSSGEDITERRRAEEALRKAHDELEVRVQERTTELQQAYDRLKEETEERQHIEGQLRQAQKMEALGTLSGGIAHDFNNILAAVIGFAELLEGYTPKGSRDARHLGRIMEAGIRGRELVRQMLTFSRKTEQEKKPFALSRIVKETVKLLRATTPSTISVHVNASNEALILADPTQVQQVLMNLCTNAAYAMQEKGGNLDIELSDHTVSPSNGNPDGLAPGQYVKLSVRDTGTGIPADIMEKIFDPFFTTKKVGEGTGLGLSVVHGIVKQHDGSITVISEPGKGSTFTVYFPRITADPESDTLRDDEIPTGSEHILFIDDEEALVEMGEDILAELGYEVMSRMSSIEALSLLKQDPHRFDLVVTDQTMPDMTGVELAKEILNIRPDMPIIMCTGFSYMVDADKAQAAGIKAFAMKPLTKREIAKTIRKVLDG